MVPLDGQRTHKSAENSWGEIRISDHRGEGLQSTGVAYLNMKMRDIGAICKTVTLLILHPDVSLVLKEKVLCTSFPRLLLRRRQQVKL